MAFNVTLRSNGGKWPQPLNDFARLLSTMCPDTAPITGDARRIVLKSTGTLSTGHLPQPVRDGYDFKQWIDASNGDPKTGAISDTIQLKADWVERKIIIGDMQFPVPSTVSIDGISFAKYK